MKYTEKEESRQKKTFFLNLRKKKELQESVAEISLMAGYEEGAIEWSYLGRYLCQEGHFCGLKWNTFLL